MFSTCGRWFPFAILYAVVLVLRLVSVSGLHGFQALSHLSFSALRILRFNRHMRGITFFMLISLGLAYAAARGLALDVRMFW